MGLLYRGLGYFWAEPGDRLPRRLAAKKITFRHFGFSANSAGRPLEMGRELKKLVILPSTTSARRARLRAFYRSPTAASVLNLKTLKRLPF